MPNNDMTDSEKSELKSQYLENTNNAGLTNAKIAMSLKYLWSGNIGNL